MLACICGACRTVRSCTTVFTLVLNNDFEIGQENNFAAAISALITNPILWVGNGALIAWAVRLLVLYDPRKRKTWGHYVREKRVARALCWTYTGMEAAYWLGAAVFGMERCQHNPWTGDTACSLRACPHAARWSTPLHFDLREVAGCRP